MPTKPVISPPLFLVMNEASGKPSRFYLKGVNLGTKPTVMVNGKTCKKVTVTKPDGFLSVLLHFADHPHRNTGEANITITVSDGTVESDPIVVPVYVDDDSSE